MTKNLFQLVSLLIAISFLLLLTTSMHAQSLVEQTGGIKTQFTITSSDFDLPIQAQALVKRGFSKHKYNSGVESGYGYGYGMEIWRLEFTTTSGISEKRIPKENDKKRYYQFNLYDDNGKALLITQLDLDAIIVVNNGNGLKTYSVNLNSIPIILLDQTKEIRIEKIWEK